MCGAWRDGAAAHGVVFDDEPSGSRGAFGAVGRGAFGSGKIMPRCVPGRRSVAIFRRGAFPGRQPWQFFRLMRSRRGLGREKRRFVARYARHASEKPCKQPSGNTLREDLAAKGPFSLHAPLESCTARISCHEPTAPHPSGPEAQLGSSGCLHALAPPMSLALLCRPGASGRSSAPCSSGASGPHTAQGTSGLPQPQRPTPGHRRDRSIPPALRRESAAAFGGASLCSVEGAHPPYILIGCARSGVFQLMFQEQLRFPAT